LVGQLPFLASFFFTEAQQRMEFRMVSPLPWGLFSHSH